MVHYGKWDWCTVGFVKLVNFNMTTRQFISFVTVPSDAQVFCNQKGNQKKEKHAHDTNILSQIINSGNCMEIHTKIMQKRKRKPSIMQEFLGNPTSIYTLTNDISISHSQSKALKYFERPPTDLISKAIRDVEQTNNGTGCVEVGQDGEGAESGEDVLKWDRRRKRGAGCPKRSREKEIPSIIIRKICPNFEAKK